MSRGRVLGEVVLLVSIMVHDVEHALPGVVDVPVIAPQVAAQRDGLVVGEGVVAPVGRPGAAVHHGPARRVQVLPEGGIACGE